MVFIKLFNQQTLSLNLNPNSTSLQTLIQTIESKTILPPHLQRLFLSSRRLIIDESNAIESISSLGVNRDSTLVLHLPLLGGMQPVTEEGGDLDVIKECGGSEKAVDDAIKDIGDGADGDVGGGAGEIEEVGGVANDVIKDGGAGADKKTGDEVVATSVEVPRGEVGATSPSVDAAERRRRKRANVVEYYKKFEIKCLEERMLKEFGEIDSWKAAQKVRLENEMARLQTELENVDAEAEARHSSARAKVEAERAKILEHAARLLAPQKAKWFGCIGI